MNIKKSSIILLGFAVCACNQGKQAESVADFEIKGDTVSVSASSPVNGKLIMDTVIFKTYNSSFTTVGTVRAEAGKLAEVGVPFDGRTAGCYAHPGHKVAAGQRLFGFHSAEFAELVKSYFQAKSNSELAKRELERKKILNKGGVASSKELEDAENAAEIAYRDLEQSENAIRMLGISPASLVAGKALDICSPIAGEVVSCEVTPGQFVKSDTAPLVIVADLKTVWVVAQVKEPYLGSVHNDDQAEIFIESSKDEPLVGKVYYVGQVLDERTRSAQVIVSCDNAERFLKPGMFVKVRFEAKSRDALLIASTAVLQGEEGSYVFVRTKENEYVRRTVSVKTADEGNVLVDSGLEEGDVIVSKGGIYIAG